MGGFTLVELLISVSIFSVIALSLYSALQAGISTYNRMDSALGAYQSARILLNRMGRDISNAFIYSADDSNFKGSSGDMDFFSVAGEFRDGENISGVCRIIYSFENGALRRASSYGIEAIKEAPAAGDEELSSDIKGVVFEYAAGTDDPEAPYLWQNSWPKQETPEQEKSLPLAVKIKLLLAESDSSEGAQIQEFNRIVALHAD